MLDLLNQEYFGEVYLLDCQQVKDYVPEARKNVPGNALHQFDFKQDVSNLFHFLDLAVVVQEILLWIHVVLVLDFDFLENIEAALLILVFECQSNFFNLHLDT